MIHKYHLIKTNIIYFLNNNKFAGKVCVVSPILIDYKSIRFGNRVFIRNFSRIEGITTYQNMKFNPVIVIEDNVSIEQNLHLTCANSIIIKKNTSIAANVTITDINHPYTDINVSVENQPIEVQHVEIGEDCKIYNNVVILPGVVMGKHCVVGANSVVGINIPDYSIVAGAPAKIIKRFNFESQLWEKTDRSGNFIIEN